MFNDDITELQIAFVKVITLTYMYIFYNSCEDMFIVIQMMT